MAGLLLVMLIVGVGMSKTSSPRYEWCDMSSAQHEATR